MSHLNIYNGTTNISAFDENNQQLFLDNNQGYDLSPWTILIDEYAHLSADHNFSLNEDSNVVDMSFFYDFESTMRDNKAFNHMLYHFEWNGNTDKSLGVKNLLFFSYAEQGDGIVFNLNSYTFTGEYLWDDQEGSIPNILNELALSKKLSFKEVIKTNDNILNYLNLRDVQVIDDMPNIEGWYASDIAREMVISYDFEQIEALFEHPLYFVNKNNNKEIER